MGGRWPASFIHVSRWVGWRVGGLAESSMYFTADAMGRVADGAAFIFSGLMMGAVSVSAQWGGRWGVSRFFQVSRWVGWVLAGLALFQT